MKKTQDTLFENVQTGDSKLIVSLKNGNPLNFNHFWKFLMSHLQNSSVYKIFKTPFVPSLGHVYFEEDTTYGYFNYHFLNIDTKKIDIANLFTWHGPYELANNVSNDLKPDQVVVLFAVVPSLARQIALLDLVNILLNSDQFDFYYCSGATELYQKLVNIEAVQAEVEKLSSM